MTEAPPGTRSTTHLQFTVCALQTTFRLQFDTTNGRVQYPPREVAAPSLSSELLWREADPVGTVLATTILRSSGSAYFRHRLPWPIALVEVGDGARIIAHALDPLDAEETVHLDLRLDRAGRGVMCARSLRRREDPPKTDGPDFAAVRAEFLAGAADADLRIIGGDHAVAEELAAIAIAAGARSVSVPEEVRRRGPSASADRSSPPIEDAWPVRADFE